MIFRFLDFELDDEIFTLRRHGVDVALRPQAFDLLIYLVKNRERTTTKQDLLDAVWKGAVVSESTLPQTVVAVRRALGDDDPPRFVQTVRARGYRFIASVEEGRGHAAPVSVTSQDGDFVGQEESLRLLEASVAKAAEGQLTIAFVSGEAGIGKTRLLAELASRARARATRVVVARCHATEGAPELWPWVEVLRGIGRDTASTFGVEALALARELAPATLGAPDAGSAEDARGRFLVFDRIARLVERAAQEGLLVVVLDDFHHADAPSLLLLKLVASTCQHATVAVVLAYRDGKTGTRAVFARTIGGLAREGSSRSIPLKGLSREEIARWATSALGAVDEATLGRLVVKSDGNPLLLRQLFQSFTRGDGAAGHSGATSALLALSEIREAVALQLEEVSPEVRTVLSEASVLGTTFTLGRLAKTIGAPLASVLARVDEALYARILAPTTNGGLRFVHVLVRDVLYAKIALADRVAIHRAAGVAALADDAPNDAVYHFERGLRSLDHLAAAAIEEGLDPRARAEALHALFTPEPR